MIILACAKNIHPYTFITPPGGYNPEPSELLITLTREVLQKVRNSQVAKKRKKKKDDETTSLP